MNLSSQSVFSTDNDTAVSQDDAMERTCVGSERELVFTDKLKREKREVEW